MKWFIHHSLLQESVVDLQYLASTPWDLLEASRLPPKLEEVFSSDISNSLIFKLPSFTQWPRVERMLADLSLYWSKLGFILDTSIYSWMVLYQWYCTRRWRKFQNRKPKERLVVVNHGWQSESADGPKGGLSCAFWSGCKWALHSQLLDVVWCSAVVVVVVGLMLLKL